MGKAIKIECEHFKQSFDFDVSNVDEAILLLEQIKQEHHQKRMRATLIAECVASLMRVASLKDLKLDDAGRTVSFSLEQISYESLKEAFAEQDCTPEKFGV